MSSERVIHNNENGAIVFFRGCAGLFYDVFGPDGEYIDTTTTKAAALALIAPKGAADEA